MIIVILSTVGILLGILNIFLFIFVKRLIDKIAIYETWIISTRNKVEETLNQMREIDKRGVFSTSINEKGIFESDDLVGEVFRDIKQIIETLNQKIQ